MPSILSIRTRSPCQFATATYGNTTEAYRLRPRFFCSFTRAFPNLVTKAYAPISLMLMERPYGNTWVTPTSASYYRHPPGSYRWQPCAAIQPLLCLSAGSGLRFESKLPMAAGHQSYLLKSLKVVGSRQWGHTLHSLVSSPSPTQHCMDPIVTPNSLQISQAPPVPHGPT